MLFKTHGGYPKESLGNKNRNKNTYASAHTYRDTRTHNLTRTHNYTCVIQAQATHSHSYTQQFCSRLTHTKRRYLSCTPTVCLHTSTQSLSMALMYDHQHPGTLLENRCVCRDFAAGKHKQCIEALPSLRTPEHPPPRLLSSLLTLPSS